MAVTFNDTSTLQGLVQHVRFLSGQDSLSINDATRLLNFARDDYDYIALTSDGRWKFDALTHENASNNATYPIATATLNANTESIPLNSDFLKINQVQIEIDGVFKVLEPVDVRDDKSEVLRETYKTVGEPIKYDYDSHSLFFYPASDTARTVKILYSRVSPYFSTIDTTATVGIPRIHHEYLALHAAHRVTLKTNDPNRVQLRQELVEFERKIRDFYSKRDEDTSRRIKPKLDSPFTSRNQ